MSEIEINPQIEASWKLALASEFRQEYFVKLKQFLLKEKQNKVEFYPPGPLIFNAFEMCPFDAVKVVILGQDPYHGAGQAHGLCFSVPEGVDIPPSLRNIYKELQDDLNIDIPKHGNLEKWAKQGVLLLNNSLTVRKNQAGSHFQIGWENFTDATIATISQQKENVVFLLWGSPAQKKGLIVDAKKHLVLKAPHPSPLSAYRGFFGCKHFSKTNKHLQSIGLKPIDWSL